MMTYAGRWMVVSTGALALMLAGGAAAQETRPSAALTYRDTQPPAPTPPARAPAGAPNVLIIMLDDVGYGQFGTFGGAIPSPAFDALAKDGLRYTRFHTAGICSPTRAALLTGRNPHNAGFGIVGELSTGHDGYTGVLPDSTATLARALRDNGYTTAMFGKNHNTPAAEVGPAGPFGHWPTGMGFDYFYGFHGWGADQWYPTLYEGTNIVPPSHDKSYTLNTDLADHAIAWMRRSRSAAPDKPYLLYFATGATHAPHHAPAEWIDRFKGQFDGGWDAYREAAFARQKRLGVIPADAVLTPRPDGIPAWDSLTPEQKRIAAREMEVFAGFSAQTDHEVGRVVQAARALPGGQNTLIVTILGDNGASAEGGPGGTISELSPGNGLAQEAAVTIDQLPALGGPLYENHMAYGWAWAVNAPFRYYKQVVSHLGGVRNPMIVSWPDRIKDPGGVRNQFLDVTDVAPTVLAAAGVAMPDVVDGVTQKPLDGVSALATLTSAGAPEVRRTQYFEVFGNRGIYHDGWFASARLAEPWVVNRAALDPFKVRWELYDLDHDYSQARDLAAQYPDKLARMQELWWAEAARNNVLPLDWRAGERLMSPGGDSGQTHFTFYPGTVGIPEKIAPVVRNRSWRISASGTFQPTDTGMIVTQGGAAGGWAFHLLNGVPVFDYNLQGIRRTRITADGPVGADTGMIEMRFAYAGKAGSRGAGGDVTILANGKPIGRGRIDRTLPNYFSINETFDIGVDYGSPVADYPFPSPALAALRQVDIDLEK